MRDAEFMARAIEVGERGRRTAPPNPWVGCLIVDPSGAVVGEGFHARRGAPHAETVALDEAGARARGATVYVTLEPCAHHGQTPPCADALIAAGVGRVVVAIEDPDERVRGRGIERLRAAGIAVDLGLAREQAARSLAPYLHHRRARRSYCVLKTATSLDGRVTAADGSSRWITGSAARRDAHELRADSQAVVIGSGTALTDRPSLTARLASSPVERQPARVLLDARGRVPASGPLFEPDLAPTIVLTSDAAPAAAVDAWRAAGAKVEVLAEARPGLDLDAVLSWLGAEGVLQAMVEGGPILHGSVVRAGLADRIVSYVAGVVLGPGGRPAFDATFPVGLDEAPRYRLLGARALGDDVRLDYSIDSLSAGRDTRPAAVRSSFGES